MARLIETRYPVYAQADLVVDSRNGPHQHTVDALIATLLEHGVLTSSVATDAGERGGDGHE
jgi:shikimate kinase